MRRGKTLKTLERECDEFNARCPVGSQVRYWTGAREGEGRVGRTKHEATVMGGHTAVAWIEGVHSVALTHVEPL